MGSLALQGVTKDFRDIRALDEVSFSVEDGEFFALLGPTGAGKTTTLRVISGLTKQDAGQVLFDDKPIDEMTPADRDVSFVFQQYSLYPTMTVYDNLAFPLRSPVRDESEEEIKARVDDVAVILHIDHLLERKTANLSGGEMQRVSIGRAIVREPRLFLMDEPLSNLDAKLREELRVELQHLQKTQGNTTLFVTHDQTEALTMADRIAVMNKGQIVQIGTPDDIYDRPVTTFVAGLVGTPRINLQEAKIEDYKICVEDCSFHIPLPNNFNPPEAFQVGLRPEDVKPIRQGEFVGKVTLTEPLGVETILHIEIGNTNLTSLVPGMTHLDIDSEVNFSLAEERIHYFDMAGKRLAQEGKA